MPYSLIETTIVPIVVKETKAGDLSSDNHYRPIALANVISNVFKSLIRLRCQQSLTTTNNQFCFKSKHSTDFSFYPLKGYIEFDKLRNTIVFVILLVASKAFDRFDNWLLFKRLIDKHIPFVYYSIVQLCWYSTQQMHKRLGILLPLHFCL